MGTYISKMKVFISSLIANFTNETRLVEDLLVPLRVKRRSNGTPDRRRRRTPLRI